ncbi:hypothetical protein BB560_000467 [Smittium megazygosporum]|uniref:Uncharacterized protein n=1 Tax=Smittium megazygosporum TaxID=133381 RepID=A0A2T9ZK95_9FUNG|nr:hypothetical protein BB560_000467 [Smittium megazygosporum]
MSIPFATPFGLKVPPSGARPHRFQYDFTSPAPNVSELLKSETFVKPIKRSLAYIIPLDPNSDSNDINGTNIPTNPLNSQEESLKSSLSNPITSNTCANGHLLGVTSIDMSDNTRAFRSLSEFQDLSLSDSSRILYSGGRDGALKAWAFDSAGNVVSGSSDLSLKVWTPFSEDGVKINTLGTHSDYVKTLAYCHGRNKILSGGLDSVIKVWDVERAGCCVSYNYNSEIKASHSIYSISCNKSGTTVATASTDKVVQLYDIRTKGSTGWLSGHTNFVTSVKISKSGEYLLSGSSDNTVKLWSLRMRKCVFTFSIHDSSVWSVDSSDPSFKTFYSGDKNGNLIKTKHKNYANSDTSVIIGKEDNSILKILPEDNEEYLWTATFGSGFNCWKNVSDSIFQQKANHLERAIQEEQLDSDPKNGLSTEETNHKKDHFKEPVHDSPILKVIGAPGLRKHIMLENKRQVLTIDSDDVISLWDLILAKKIKVFDKEWGTDLESIANSLNDPPESVPSWCSVDTKIGLLTVRLEMNQVWDSEVYADQLTFLSRSECVELLNYGIQRISIGPWVLKNLLENFNALEFLYKNDVENYADSISSWVSDSANGGSLLLKEIIERYPKNENQSLKDVQHIRPPEKSLILPPSVTERAQNAGTTTKSQLPEQINSKINGSVVTRLFSWKGKKKNLTKRSVSESPVSKTIIPEIPPQQRSANPNSQNSQTDSEEYLKIDNSTKKIYGECTETEKNLIRLIESKNFTETRSRSGLSRYPHRSLPSDLRLVLLEEHSSGPVPYCIYLSSIRNSRDNKPYAFHRVKDNQELTLAINLPSWVTEHFVCLKYPFSYKFPVPLNFNLRPHTSPYMQIASLGTYRTNLTAQRMLRISKMTSYVAESLRLYLPPEAYIDSLVDTLGGLDTDNTSEETSVTQETVNLGDSEKIDSSANKDKMEANTPTKSVLELGLESLGEEIGVEERIAIRALSKSQMHNIFKGLTLIIQKLNKKYLKTDESNSHIIQDDDKERENLQETQADPSNEAVTQTSNSILGAVVAESSSDMVDDGSAALVFETPKMVYLSSSNLANSFAEMELSAQKSQSDVPYLLQDNRDPCDLAFLWIDLFCKNKKLDPLMTLGTLRSSIWKSSQEIEISYKWKQFVVDRIKRYKD